LVTRIGVVALLVLVASVLWAQTESAALPPSEKPAAEQQIRGVLNAQVEAWNRGDLEGYMAGYWNSPDLTFFSNATQTQGWQPTLERYKQRYQGAGHSMGTVSFPKLQVTILAPDAAFVRGEWHLQMADGKEPHGMFTLVLRRFPEGWRIVHDHSSGE
jgi:ketosteroid isomerase-like protein